MGVGGGGLDTVARLGRINPLFLFVHIPKTAGQTLRDHFIRHMNLHETFIHLGPYGIEDAQRLGLEPFEKRSSERRNRAHVILGHLVTCSTADLVPGKSPHFITFLREPAERIVSLYNFMMDLEFRRRGKEPVSFDEWWSSRRHQTMVNWVCRDYLGSRVDIRDQETAFKLALKTLRQFWFIGTVATITEDAKQLMRAIGLPDLAARDRSNIGGVHFDKTLDPEPKLLERIRADCLYDVELYRFFLERRQSVHD